MLIQFSFENFLSFKDRMTLSLKASSLKESTINEEDAMSNAGASIGAVLHCAAIYGANASGKSNLFKALEVFIWMVKNSMKNLQIGETLNIESYRLNKDTAEAPSMFEIVISNEENIYRYGFEADSQKIYSEWLYQKNNRKRAKEVELIYREGNNFTIHPKLSITKELSTKKMVRENALMLSVAAQFNDPIAVNVTKMISDINILSSKDEINIWNQAVTGIDDKDIRKRIIALTKFADLGIDDIEKINDTVVSRHNQYDEQGKIVKQVSFIMKENESEGTLKYFSLAYPLLKALDHGTTLVIDEFDSQLHPILLTKIIEMFNSSEVNRNKAQLIFTLHNSNVMGGGLLRRDQIWFTQKKRTGESELYSLAEYNVRKNAQFEKDYISGKYGAIPVIGNLNNAINPEESHE